MHIGVTKIASEGGGCILHLHQMRQPEDEVPKSRRHQGRSTQYPPKLYLAELVRLKPFLTEPHGSHVGLTREKRSGLLEAAPTRLVLVGPQGGGSLPPTPHGAVGLRLTLDSVPRLCYSVHSMTTLEEVKCASSNR